MLLDFVSKETDVLIIGKILGMEVLGLYSLTKQLVLRLFNVVNPIITNVLSPWLASLQQEPEKQKTTYLLITRYLAYLNFPLYLVFAIGTFDGAARCAPCEWRAVRRAPRCACLVTRSVP